MVRSPIRERNHPVLLVQGRDLRDAPNARVDRAASGGQRADLDPVAFASLHQRLLQQERAAEIAETERQMRAQSEAELEAQGVLLRRLEVADLEPGLGGALHAHLRPSRGGPLPSHRFAPGDVVALDDGSETNARTATVASVRSEHLVVAIEDDGEVDLPPLVRLRRIAPDVTFRRMHDALNWLRTGPGPEQKRLVEVAFGQREPAFAEARPWPLPPDPRLDESQRAAVQHALFAEQLALVHGPPGTGKTTAVVELVRQSCARGEHVLAAAPSNVAVDNLVERLVQAGLRVVRLGHPVRVLPAVVEHTLSVLVQASEEQKLLKDVRHELRDVQRKFWRAARSQRAELKQEQRRLRDEQRTLERAIVQGLLDTADVVCCTTTGAGDHVLQGRLFDLAVVDEAAQAFEAATWLALRKAKKGVLAGDHLQLPPTVTSEEAAKEGLARTMFERLALGEPGKALARMLTTQYRMHERVQAWSAQRFYGGRLVPHESVRSHRLCDLPDVVLTELTEQPLCFVDTAGCGHDESEGQEDGSKRNEGEARVVAAHVRSLLEAGVAPQQIAVITPYSAQVRLLRDRLSGIEGLEIGTVDGLQGREKEAVVLSLVRSNERGEVGFLAELRRLNVALTRARRHLCVVGDSATLAQHADLGSLVDHLQATGAYRSAWGLGE